MTEMHAGRELDALIAERVMGWSDFWWAPEYGIVMAYPPSEQAMGIYGERHPVPPYSEGIAAAWQVVEHLTKPGRAPQELYFKMTHAWDDDYGTWAYFDWKGTSDGHPLYGANAATAPLAICLAALKAVAS